MIRTFAYVVVLAASLCAVYSAQARTVRNPATRAVVLIVDDPRDPCRPHQVTICVPICSVEPPCVSWRDGVFGRRVATYVWPSSGYEMEVIVTRRGDVIVR
jgi:hypothetical protein